MKRRVTALVASLVTAAAAFAVAGCESRSYIVIEEGVLLAGGQPTRRELRDLRRTVKLAAVVDLRRPTEDSKAFAREFEAAADFGIEFVSIPLAEGRAPRKGDVERFLRLMRNEERRPVLVHGGTGSGRAAAFVAVYGMEVKGWTLAQAGARMRAMGFDGAKHPALARFVARYSPRRAPGSLPGR